MILKNTIKTILFLPALLLHLSCNALPSDKDSHLENNCKKYEISICAIFKNEKKYLKEWIEYHLLIGIDHFYLYNNNSSDFPLNTLASYIKKGIVTVISWPDELHSSEKDNPMWALSTQISAYENAIQVRARGETEWLILMDINEFLVANENCSLKDMLKKHSGSSGIALHQDCFDASNCSMAQQKLVIEANELISSEKLVCTGVEKIIFKPLLCEYFTWPPYKYIFKNNQLPIKLSKQQLRINRYLHRFKTELYFGENKQKLCIDNRSLTETDLHELLESNYKIEDQEGAIASYVPKMKKIMGHEGRE